MRQIPRYITNASLGQNSMGARPRNHPSPVSQKMGSPLFASTKKTCLRTKPTFHGCINSTLTDMYTNRANAGYRMDWEKESSERELYIRALISE